MRTTLDAVLAALLVLPATVLVGAAGPAAAEGSVDTDYGRMVLVLDSSGSMAEGVPGGGTKIAAAKTSLRTVIGDLPDEAQVGLRVFGSTVFSRSQAGACRDTRLVVEPGTGNRDDLLTAVAGYRPYGETPISQALLAAADDLGGEGKRSIVLVSDGEATCAPDPCEVAARIAARGVDLQIDVVGLDVGSTAREQLQCVAERGGGTYYDAGSAEDITASLARVSERAVRPFTFSGARVEGSDEPVTPTDLAAGEWVDEIGPESDPAGARYYRLERTVPGSTMHVSAQTFGGTERFEALRLVLGTEDGASCDTAYANRTVATTQVFAGRVSAPTDVDPGQPDECRDADALLLTVSRQGTQSTGDAPLALKVVEESPVTTVEDLPPSTEPGAYVAPEVEGVPVSVLGGTSFADAPEIGTGRYQGTIVPGETQVLRVPLTWGQSVTARVLLPARSDALDAEIVGALSPTMTLELFDPMRSQLSAYHDGDTTVGFASTSIARSLLRMTDPVRYLDRTTTSGEPPYLPGDHYVSLAVEPDPDGATYELPFVLETEVVGEPAGAPEYRYPELAPDAPGSGLRADLPVADPATGTSDDTTPSADPSVEPSVDPSPSTATGTASPAPGSASSAPDASASDDDVSFARAALVGALVVAGLGAIGLGARRLLSR